MKVTIEKLVNSAPALTHLAATRLAGPVSLRVFLLSEEVNEHIRKYNEYRRSVFTAHGCAMNRELGRWEHAVPEQLLAAIEAMSGAEKEEVEIATPGITFQDIEKAEFSPGVLKDLNWWITL